MGLAGSLLGPPPPPQSTCLYLLLLYDMFIMPGIRKITRPEKKAQSSQVPIMPLGCLLPLALGDKPLGLCQQAFCSKNALGLQHIGLNISCTPINNMSNEKLQCVDTVCGIQTNWYVLHTSILEWTLVRLLATTLLCRIRFCHIYRFAAYILCI